MARNDVVRVSAPNTTRAEKERRRKIAEEERERSRPRLERANPNAVDVRSTLEQLWGEPVSRGDIRKLAHEKGNLLDRTIAIVDAVLDGLEHVAPRSRVSGVNALGTMSPGFKLPPHPGKNLGERGAVAGYLAERNGTSVNQELKEHYTKGKDLKAAGRRRSQQAAAQREAAQAETGRLSPEDISQQVDYLVRNHSRDVKPAELIRQLASTGIGADDIIRFTGLAMRTADPETYTRSARYYSNALARVARGSSVRSDLQVSVGQLADSHLVKQASSDTGTLNLLISSVGETPENIDKVVGSVLFNRWLRSSPEVPSSLARSVVEGYGGTSAVRALLKNPRARDAAADALSQVKGGLSDVNVARTFVNEMPDDPRVVRAIRGSGDAKVKTLLTRIKSTTARELAEVADGLDTDKDITESAAYALMSKRGGAVGNEEFLLSRLRRPGGSGLAGSRIGTLLVQGKYTPPAIRSALAESPELAVPALRGLVNNYGTWNVRPNNIVDLMRRIEDWAYSLPQDVLQDTLLNMWKGTDRIGADNLRTAVNLMNIREAWADKTLLKKGKIPDIAAANVRMMDDLERAGLDLTGINRRFRAAVSPYGDQRLVLHRVNSLGNALADFDTYGGLDNFSMYVTPASRKARGIHAGFSRPEPIGPSGDPAYGYKVVYQMDPSAFPVSPRVIAYSRDAGTSMSGQTTSESMSGRLGSRTGYSFFKELSGLSGWHIPLAFSETSTRTGVGWAGHSDFRSYPMSVIDNLYSTTLNPEFPSRLDFGEVKANLKVPASDFGRFMGKALIVEGKDANRTDEVSRAIRSLREKLESVGVSTEEVRSDSNFKTDGRRTESEAQRASDFTMAAKGGNASESIRAAEDAGDNAPDLTGMSNFLATDRVPDTIFGIPVVSRREDYTEEDLAFFKEHPEAGGYYDMGEGTPEDGSDEGAPVQADRPKYKLLSEEDRRKMPASSRTNGLPGGTTPIDRSTSVVFGKDERYRRGVVHATSQFAPKWMNEVFVDVGNGTGAEANRIAIPVPPADPKEIIAGADYLMKHLYNKDSFGALTRDDIERELWAHAKVGELASSTDGLPTTLRGVLAPLVSSAIRSQTDIVDVGHDDRKVAAFEKVYGRWADVKAEYEKTKGAK